MFDFKSFLIENGIDFIDSGKNVKRGNLNVNCPFCNLPVNHHSSHHLGIDPKTNFWACWRDSSHRGRRPQRLVMKLLGCSYGKACEILGISDKKYEEDTFESLASGRFFGSEDVKEEKRENKLVYPREFRKFDGEFKTECKFLNYLSKDRGFGKDVLNVCGAFDLRYAVTGDYADRIIIPIQRHGRLVSWTSRAVSKGVKLRYKTLSNELSYIPPKNFLFNYDKALKGGEVLFILEGPFDVYKMDFFSDDQVHAVGLLNMSCEPDQEYWLRRLYRKYNRVVVLLDKGEFIAENNLLDTLSFIPNLVVGQLPDGCGDPGDLTAKQVTNLCEEVCLL